ncbi:hypothetical protein CC2G_007816 [Coprinopsis cinerea AmutBmut pab1-1]|nr:hypothetical protein CC2G_007816 [Coprinopsis cinerea AmutBmut pab1-1]
MVLTIPKAQPKLKSLTIGNPSSTEEQQSKDTLVNILLAIPLSFSIPTPLKLSSPSNLQDPEPPYHLSTSPNAQL